MRFGLKISQDIFQAKIDQTFEDCEGVVGIADDIVISGKTEEEHDRNLHRMIGGCRSTGLKLNRDKCFMKQKKIKFYGLICGPDGMQSDPDKVSVLKQMSPPKKSQKLQAFVGIATYIAPFISNPATIPLHCVSYSRKETHSSGILLINWCLKKSNDPSPTNSP